MERSLQIQALAIMDELAQHPCSKNFLKPIDPDASYATQYYQLIEEPVDMSTIRHRLELNRYKTLIDWHREMRLIWQNCIKFNGALSPIGVLSEHFYELFEKRYNKLSNSSLKKWTTAFSLLNLKFQNIMNQIPSQGRFYCILNSTLLFSNPKLDIPFLQLVSKPIVPSSPPQAENSPNQPAPAPTLLPTKLPDYPTEHEIQCFLEAASSLSSSYDAKNLRNLISKNQPELGLTGIEPEVNCDILLPKTIRDLITYTKNRFNTLDLQYPV